MQCRIKTADGQLFLNAEPQHIFRTLGLQGLIQPAGLYQEFLFRG